jgi:hypothetical protein
MKKFLSILFLACFLFSGLTAFSQSKSKKNKRTKTTTTAVVTTPTDKTDPAKTDPGKTNPGKTDPVITNPVAKPVTAQPVRTAPLTYDQVYNNARPIIQESPNGNVNWTEQFVEAKGASVIDNNRFENPAQAKAMATRGAVVIAQRNLLEILKGVNVTSETTVQDMVTTNDYVYTRIDGLVKGAKQVGEAIEKDGMMHVTMRVPLYGREGLSSAVYNELPQIKGRSAQVITETPKTGTTQAADALSGNEGLVFNIKGKTIDPAMFPVVVDENGQLLLDMTKLYDPNSGNFPKILQSSEQLFNDLGFAKGVDVIDAIQGEKGKIVLDSKNAKKVDWGKIGSVVGSLAKFILMLF